MCYNYNRGDNMKKLLLVFMASLLLTGCSNEEKQKEQLEEASRSYYEKYMSGVKGSNEAVVTLEMLNKAKETNNDDYKLSALKGCKSHSKVTFTVSDEGLVDPKFELACE